MCQIHSPAWECTFIQVDEAEITKARGCCCETEAESKWKFFGEIFNIHLVEDYITIRYIGFASFPI